MDWNKSVPSNVKLEPRGKVEQMIKPFRKLGDLKPMPMPKMTTPKVETPASVDYRQRSATERCCHEYGKTPTKDDQLEVSSRDMGIIPSSRY